MYEKVIITNLNQNRLIKNLEVIILKLKIDIIIDLNFTIIKNIMDI
jgi:hypothetical protein